MNVKMFSGIPSEDLEAEINTWLTATNPTIAHVKQSQCFTDFNPDSIEDNGINITITIWYSV